MAVNNSGHTVTPGLMAVLTTGEGAGEGAGEGSTAAAVGAGPNVKTVKSGEGEGEAEDNRAAWRRSCKSFVAFHNAQEMPGGGANVGGNVVGLSVAIVLLNSGKRGCYAKEFRLFDGLYLAFLPTFGILIPVN